MGKGPEQTLLQKGRTDAQWTYEKCSSHWSSEQCKLKPQWDITSHLSEWLSHRQINKQQLLGRKWSRGNKPLCTTVGIRTGAATKESSVKLPPKKPYDPEILLLGNLSKETWNNHLKEYRHPYVHCSVIYNSQDMEAAQVSISRWINKTAVILYTIEYYLALKKKEILPFATACMDLENIMLSENSQLEKDKYMISLKRGM